MVICYVNMILHVKLNLGIGDIIAAKTILDTKKNEYDKIHIHFNHEIYDYKTTGRKYFDFIHNFIKTLFSEEPYLIDYSDTNVSQQGFFDFFNEHNFIKPDIKKYFVFDDTKTDDKYIIVQTKIRGFGIDKFNNEKHKIFETINNISKNYKLVILGERKIVDNKETLIHKNNIFCIYNDIVNFLDKDRLVDMTTDLDIYNDPNIDQFKKDCNIINKSHSTITFGISGSFIIAMSVGNVINYYDPYFGGSLFWKIENSKFDDLFLYSKLEDFNKKLINIE